MLVYDRKENHCAAFEIKHSRQAVPEQARHLRDAEKCALTERRFGKLVGKYVLYLGQATEMEDGVVCRNVEKFLKELPAIRLSMKSEETMTNQPRARHTMQNI